MSSSDDHKPSVTGVVLALQYVGAPPSDVASSDSVWQNENDPSEHLALVHYADSRAADEDLRKVFDGSKPIPPELNLPVEIHRIIIRHTDGRVLNEVPVGGRLTVARTLASPGYGEAVGEGAEEMLATFAQLEGYCGHVQGPNETVLEESWALVFTEPEANAPIFTSPVVSVRTYRRER